MQSAGQAAAHSEQPTHFSSPVSSNRCSLWRPRKRGYTGVFSSGYWYVCVPSAQRARVVFRPRSVSPNARYVPRTGPPFGARTTSMTSGPGSYGHQDTTTRIAVTRALIVAIGRKTFHPSDISWS